MQPLPFAPFFPLVDQCLQAVCNDALFDDNYVFNPTFDDAYIADMEAISAFLASTGRIRDPQDVLDYTYTDPVASIDPSLVQVRGRWTP